MPNTPAEEMASSIAKPTENLKMIAYLLMALKVQVRDYSCCYWQERTCGLKPSWYESVDGDEGDLYCDDHKTDGCTPLVLDERVAQAFAAIEWAEGRGPEPMLPPDQTLHIVANITLMAVSIMPTGAYEIMGVINPEVMG